MMHPKPPKPWRSESYRAWVRTLPCANCGRERYSECHHIKGVGHHSGVGRKADDRLSMPLCGPMFWPGSGGCHGAAHDGYRVISEKQPEWAMQTQRLAVEAGVLDESQVLEIGGDATNSANDGSELPGVSAEIGGENE